MPDAREGVPPPPPLPLALPQPLAALGVAVLDSRTWHPTAEQKRGRDSSAETRAVLDASYCNHHFVSSWMEHDRAKHSTTDGCAAAEARRRLWCPSGRAYGRSTRGSRIRPPDAARASGAEAAEAAEAEAEAGAAAAAGAADHSGG